MDNPALGQLDVYVGTCAQLQEFDPDFPEDASTEPSPTRVLVIRDGVIIHRGRTLFHEKICLDKAGESLKPGKFGTMAGFGTPFLKLVPNLTRSALVEISTRDNKGRVVIFDAPAGSKAEKRYEAMEASPFKRWFFPLVQGIGKSGWAILVLVVGPLVSNILDPIWRWLSQFLPDWHLPDWHLPSIPWPHIHIPTPDIHLDLPDWHLLGWMQPILIFLAYAAEYSKIWVPIVVGIAIGIGAVRNNKKSKAIKAEWAEAAKEDSTSVDPEDS